MDRTNFKEKIIDEWKKHILQTEDLIKRHEKNGHYDLAEKVKKMKKEYEKNLEKLLSDKRKEKF